MNSTMCKIFMVAVLLCMTYASPVPEPMNKDKRGALLTNYYSTAYHPEPVLSHAPVYAHAAPIVAHAPAATSYSHFSISHNSPAVIAHAAPVYAAHAPAVYAAPSPYIAPAASYVLHH